MWQSHLTTTGSVTETISLPSAGVVGINKPDNIELSAYVNNVQTPLHHIHVNAGDTLYFKLEDNKSSIPSTIDISYAGSIHKLNVSANPQAVPSSISAHSEQTLNKEMDLKMMKEDINIFGGSGAGTGGAMGAGLGAGVLGGVLGGVLLNRNGLLNNGGDGGNFVTPTQLQTGLDAVTGQIQNNSILQTLGDIKSAVPLAESQVQLALAGVQNDINAQINSATSNLLNNQTGLARDIATTTATIIASENATQDVVQNGIASVNLGIANLATAGLQNTYSLANTIRDDGDRTRALIVSQNDANLQRQLATAESALLEQRAIGRSRDVEVNVTQNVNQNQLQMQQQQQYQTLATALSTLLSQNQHISNGIVNLGTMTASGNPVNANTRVNS